LPSRLQPTTGDIHRTASARLDEPARRRTTSDTHAERRVRSVAARPLAPVANKPH